MTNTDNTNNTDNTGIRAFLQRWETRLSTLHRIAGGFLGTALLSYFFFQRFGAGEAAIAALFFAARAANAVSHFGAAWLALRKVSTA